MEERRETGGRKKRWGGEREETVRDLAAKMHREKHIQQQHAPDPAALRHILPSGKGIQCRNVFLFKHLMRRGGEERRGAERGGWVPGAPCRVHSEDTTSRISMVE